jgi:anaerobic carbon-monoxide dehydrogenase iron sulfur subunit
MKVYRIDPKKCTLCHNCELACSFRHYEGNPPLKPRIFVVQQQGLNLPLTCLQCDDAACVKVCPTTALVRNEATGAVELRPGRCIGCRMCVNACPFGHAAFDEAKQQPLKCDLCNGNPACVPFCPTQALTYR